MEWQAFVNTSPRSDGFLHPILTPEKVEDMEEGAFNLPPQNINQLRMQFVERVLRRDLSHLRYNRPAGTISTWVLEPGIELEHGKLIRPNTCKKSFVTVPVGS